MIKTLACFVVAFFVVYLMVAFIRAEPNPFIWPADSRYGMCVIGLGLGTIITTAFHMMKEL